MSTPPVSFRDEPRPPDVAAVREIVSSTGFFHDFEIDVAVELVQERLGRGLASGYFFVFADDPATGRTLGYTCFGPIACTQGSFDLYWIAVHNDSRGQGLGRLLMGETERRIGAGLQGAGEGGGTIRGRGIYIETSSQPKYEPTREFYRRCAYVEEARLRGFYAADDDKLIYVKRLGS
jgi:D-alanine-D-alanine ligase